VIGMGIMFQLELIVSIGAGLAVLGIGLVGIDYFLARLVKRMHPEGSQGWRQVDISELTSKDQRRFQAIPSRYEEMTSRKMRKRGFAVSVCGLLILAGCGVWHLFSK